MIYFLYGDETYQLHARLKKIKSDFLHQAPHATTVVHDCDEGIVHTDIVASLSVQDLFSQKKMIIVKNYFAHFAAAEQKILQKELMRSTDDTIVMWEMSVPRKNASLFTWLKEQADHVFVSDVLEGVQLEKWITVYVGENGGDIEKEAVKELIAYVGNDLWHIVSEVQKLIAYTNGTKIEMQNVQQLVHGMVDADIFATIEAICGARKDLALQLLRRQRAKGDDGFYVFNMYAYHVRALLRVGSVMHEMKITDKNGIAKVLKIHPFVAQKALATVRTISYDRLKKAHRMLSVFDHEIKTGKRDIDTALDLFVMTF